MQGFERTDGQVLDAQRLAGHLIPAGSMFAFLAAHRAEVFPDADYADLFAPPGVGRPSLPASVMAAVLALQALCDYSDRETAEAVRFDVRWKAATGAPLDDPGFDPSSLVYWRNRIARSARPHRINDAVKKVVEQTGILKGRRRRAVDSTILADAVATQDTVTQLISVIRKVAREVPGAAGQIAAVCTGHDYSAPGKPKIDWDDPAAKEALVSALVNDANAVVAALDADGLDERAASALALLALVAGQDVEPAEGSDGRDGRWRIARKVAEGRVISTVDPDARHTRKSPEARRDGYRAHVAADPETGIITDEKLTKAAGQENSDPAVAEQFLAAEATRKDSGQAGAAADCGPDAAGSPDSGGEPDGDDEPPAWYGDSAYGPGDLPGRAHRRAQPHPDRHLRRLVPGLPAAGPVHHLQDRPQARPAPPRRPAPGRPRGLGRPHRAARELHEAPAQRRTRRRPGRHLAGTPPQAPLPRHRQEQRLAQAPHRRAEPAQPARQGPDPPRRRLGAGHLTSQQGGQAWQADPAGRAGRRDQVPGQHLRARKLPACPPGTRHETIIPDPRTPDR